MANRENYQDSGGSVNQRLIFDVLVAVFEADYELRPDIMIEAARAVAAGQPMRLAGSDRGDPFLDSETIDRIYKAALFVAAVVRTAKDSYDLTKSVISDLKKRHEGDVKVIGEHETRELIEEVKKRTSDFDDVQ